MRDLICDVNYSVLTSKLAKLISALRSCISARASYEIHSQTILSMNIHV